MAHALQTVPLLLALIAWPTAIAGGGGDDEAPARSPARSLEERAAEIDKLVEAGLRTRNQRPNPVVDDATFLRRAYLSILGRIPTIHETRGWLGKTNPSKRETLVDDLLDSPARVGHDFHWWADLLRVQSRLPRQTSGEPYADWIRGVIRDNRPYDEVVRELITAEGPAHARGGGPVGYYMRDRGMPEDNMANTARVFLGTRLECAQCHDHPFDRWKQKEFFELCAFTGGLTERFTLRGAAESGVEIAWLEDSADFRELQREVREEHGRQGQQALGRLLRTFLAGIDGSGKGVAQLPQDYQYEDAKPREVVVASTPFGTEVDVGVEKIEEDRATRRRRGRQRGRGRNNAMARYPQADSRTVFADWLTAPENPRFAKVIANRMWKRVFGRGLIEPLDDIKDDTAADNPELMGELERLMVELDFDLLEFRRVLMHTKLFEREASRGDVDPEVGYGFPGPVLRRLSAEQIWDSVLALARADIDDTLDVADVRAEQVYRQFEELASLTREELLEEVEFQMLRFTDVQEFRKQAAERRRKQRARMATEMGQMGSGGDVQSRIRELQKQIRQARRKKDQDMVAELQKQIEALRKGARRQRQNQQLVRAAALQSPAPPGHFLRQFGQSDRESIENAYTDASVPQVLTLLNGFGKQGGGMLLAQEMKQAKSPQQKIRVCYLAMLNREPTAKEQKMWLQDHGKYGEEVWKDLSWTLVNTHEFRFLR